MRSEGCILMLSVGRWQPETRERFPVFGIPWAREVDVFFGKPKLRQREVAGPMYRACMERWKASIMSSTPDEQGGLKT
jgi:hypothetical protein